MKISILQLKHKISSIFVWRLLSLLISSALKLGKDLAQNHKQKTFILKLSKKKPI